RGRPMCRPGRVSQSLPGGVPDADDTPGAILALLSLATTEKRVLDDTWDGLWWLWRIQNRDGGWPTFCRGWGNLPFDGSGADLTAHAMRAQMHPPYLERERWHPDPTVVSKGEFMREPVHSLVASSLWAGLDYLARTQRPDGSWLPLWFGNQHAPDDINP